MKSLLTLVCALLLIGCSDAGSSQNNLPPAVELNADAITARQTSDSASARANGLSAQATAARQATREAAELSRQSTLDVSNQRSTDAAIRLSFLQVTATAQAQATAGAMVEKTESARDAAAVHTSIALNAERTATAAMVHTATRRADDDATATRAAYRRTETRDAEISLETQKQKAQAEQDAHTQRERERELEQMRFQTEITAAPYVSAFGLFFPYCLGVSVLAFILWSVWRVVGSLVNQINASTLATQATAAPQLLIKDVHGNPIGFLEPTGNGAMVYRDIRPAIPEPQEHKANANRGTTQALPPPSQGASEFDSLMLKGRIHYISLRAFTKAILLTGDWTQDSWAGRLLPNGFVLSKDTVDENGQRVEGGYSFVLSLFTEKNLIIERKAGASGKWNPNAPTDVESVVGILFGNVPMPPLPPAPVRGTPARTNRKRTGKPILTAN